MALLSTSGISSGSVIFPEHVLRSIEALNGVSGPYDFTLSGSLNVSGSMRIAASSLLQNNNAPAVLSYNTSSGDIYFTTGSLGDGVIGTDGTSGTSGTSGADGTNGTSGLSGTSGTSGTAGTDGTSGTNGTSGTSGATGDAGTSGTSGTSGVGVIAGGTSGQILAKIDGTDYNTEWVDQIGTTTGSYTGSFTGSFLGDIIGSSVSASTSITASYVLTSSFADRATSSSIADEASTLSATATASISNTSVTASHALTLSGNATSSFADRATSASIADTLATTATASFGDGTFSGSFSGSFQGDGSGLTGVSGGDGISEIYNNVIRYEALDLGNSGADGRIEILSSGTAYGKLSWSRSSTTLSITKTGHGLSNGDYIVLRNVNTDYLYASASNVTSNAFDVTGVPNSGGILGTTGYYVPAAKATLFDENGATISSPSSGSIQIQSIQITTPTKSNTTFVLTMPTSISNGAGDNNSLYYQVPPINQVWNLSNGGQNTSAVITLNTSTNFNQFSIGGLTNLVKNLIKLSF